MPDDVLAFQDRLTVWLEAEAPEPVSTWLTEEGWALLATVNDAVAVPDVSGLKVMENEALWPAGIVIGKESPPMLKTELFVVAAVTVTSAPLAVRAPDAVPLEPTTTLPKFNVLGLTANCPAPVVPPPWLDFGDPELNPWHATRRQREASSNIVPPPISR
jgi:hypothetical protein